MVWVGRDSVLVNMHDMTLQQSLYTISKDQRLVNHLLDYFLDDIIWSTTCAEQSQRSVGLFEQGSYHGALDACRHKNIIDATPHTELSKCRGATVIHLGILEQGCLHITVA